jgi:antitoxin (DNA-binding transcriptional repressor) of toxin-antitoxin stability system
MDVLRFDEREVDWPGLVERVEAGATVEILRGGHVLATVTPGPRTPHPSWAGAGVDWDELRRFRESLPPDPVDSVAAMRGDARY